MAQRLETAEQGLVAHARQALVDEHVGGAEDHAAVGVVLHLLGGLIADAHRAHAAEAGEVGGDALFERLVVDDAIDRLQRPLDVDRQRRDVVDVVFHRLGRAQAVEGANDEIGVPQPAEPVVPIALRVRRLGDRGGVGGDDRARLLEVAQLQRDGGADDRRLPVERNAQPAHPVEPVVARALQELARDRIDGGLERLVGPEDQCDGMRQRERGLMGDVGQRRIGRQPQDVGAAGEAHVIGADGLAIARLAVIERRPQPNGDARQSADGLDPADDLGGVKGTLKAHEARREVGDLYRVAVAVLQKGLDDRRVAHVRRSGFRRPVPMDDNVAKALLLVAREQAREDGV